MDYKHGDCIITYRKPNFADAQIIFGEINLGNIDFTSKEKNWNFILLGKITNAMGFLIDEIKIKDEIKTFDSILNSPKYSPCLAAVAAEIVNGVMEFSSAK